VLRFLQQQRRLRLLYFAAKGGRPGVSRRHFVHNVFGPTCKVAASSLIERETVEGKFRLIYFKGIEQPLYYPAHIPDQSLYGVIREMLPKSWHHYEIPETRVNAGDVVFDIGAAEGIFTFYTAPRARHVYAFEPLPEFLECLRRTFKHQKNVTVVPAGIAERPSTAWLRKEGAGSEVTDVPTDTPIPLESVDAYCARTGVIPTYLKADIEGCERRMLQGAAETITRHKPRIAITTYHYAGDTEFIENILRRFNPAYRFRVKGIEANRGDPMMLHAW
jgi:FkbM family methyltransferase